MKMKKLLSGIIAAAMTVTAVTATSLTINAATGESDSELQNASWIQLVINSGDQHEGDGTNWVSASTWTQASGETSIDFTEHTGKYFNYIAYQVGLGEDHQGEAYKANIRIDSVVLVKTDDTEVEIAKNLMVTDGSDTGEAVTKAFEGYEWSIDYACDDYKTLTMKYTFDPEPEEDPDTSDSSTDEQVPEPGETKLQNASWIQLVINSGAQHEEDGTNWVSASTWAQASGETSIDFTEHAGKYFNYIAYQVGLGDDHQGEAYKANIRIDSVILVKADDTEVEIAKNLMVTDGSDTGEAVTMAFEGYDWSIDYACDDYKSLTMKYTFDPEPEDEPDETTSEEEEPGDSSSDEKDPTPADSSSDEQNPDPTPTPDAPTLPDGYKKTSEKSGKGTIGASDDDPSAANPYLATLSQAEYKFSEDDYILVTVAPAENTTRAAIDTSKWKVKLLGFDGNWSGWQGPESDEGVLGVGVSIKDILNVNTIDGIDLLNGINVEVSGAPIGTEINYTVVTAVNENSDEPENPSESDMLWEGEQEMPSDWSGSLLIAKDKFVDAKAGDKLVLTFTAEAGAQIALKYDGDGWPALPGFAAINDGNDYQEISGTSYTYTLTEEDLEAINGANNLVISGHDYTLTKVELSVKASDPSESTALWEGEQEMPSDWSGSLLIAKDKFVDAKAGDKLVLTFTAEAGAQIALKYDGDGWPALPGFAAINDGNDYQEISGTSYTYTLTEEDLEAINGANNLVISGHDYTLTKVELSVQSTGDEPGEDTNTGSEEPTPTPGTGATLPSGSFAAPTTSGNDTTAAPDNGTSAPAVTDTTAAPADNTTDNGDDSSSAPAQVPDSGSANTGNADQAPSGDSNNAGNTSGSTDDKNVPTGIVFAVIPAAAAAAAVVISKKRK